MSGGQFAFDFCSMCVKVTMFQHNVKHDKVHCSSQMTFAISSVRVCKHYSYKCFLCCKQISAGDSSGELHIYFS